jgi:cold-inducible RNA-binding protein
LWHGRHVLTNILSAGTFRGVIAQYQPAAIGDHASETSLLHNETGRSTMGNKRYVGSLAYEMDDSGLVAMFSAYGSVRSAQVIKDRTRGRSKGFGFVEMDNDTEARAAIAGLNGKHSEGNPGG